MFDWCRIPAVSEAEAETETVDFFSGLMLAFPCFSCHRAIMDHVGFYIFYNKFSEQLYLVLV